jgi:hypothetical protein
MQIKKIVVSVFYFSLLAAILAANLIYFVLLYRIGYQIGQQDFSNGIGPVIERLLGENDCWFDPPNKDRK